jgi:hypothetical protein
LPKSPNELNYTDGKGGGREWQKCLVTLHQQKQNPD